MWVHIIDQFVQYHIGKKQESELALGHLDYQLGMLKSTSQVLRINSVPQLPCLETHGKI
jgi:hypothetical protein